MMRTSGFGICILAALAAALSLTSCNSSRGGRMAVVAVRGNPLDAVGAAEAQYVVVSEIGVTEPSGAMADSVSSFEDYAAIVENPFRPVADEPLSTFAIDVDAASYSNTRRFINDGMLPPANAIRIEELINYFRYNYPQPTGEHPFSVLTEVAACPWSPSHRLVQIGLQGRAMASEQLPPSHLTFLIDVSGSMDEPRKLPLLKQAFRLLVDQLTPRDQVAIVVYAGAAGTVLESTSGSQKEKIREALDGLQAGGSTAGAEGIQLAYDIAEKGFIKGGNNRVILATDGDFNVGVSGDDELVSLIERAREKGIFLSVLGFGMGNLKDSKMEKIADHGNGHYAYIDGPSEAKKVFMTELGSTLYTIAKDVKLQVVFNPALVKEYRLIGYENRLLAVEDFEDDTKDAGELGAGHSVTAIYEIVPHSSAVAGVERRKLDTLDLPTEFWRDQMAQVRLRYKQPQGTASVLLTQPAVDRGAGFAEASENLRFAASVAAYGMLLRGSKHTGTARWDDVDQWARESVGTDLEGYRAEFVELVGKARELANTKSARR